MSETCQKWAFTHPIVVLKSGLKNNWMKKSDRVNRPIEGWKNGRLERTIKELSQFDNKKPEELESEFDHLMRLIRIQLRLFKGCNIVDLDFMYKRLLDSHKLCNTTLSLTQYQRERLISLTSILCLNLQCNDSQNKHLRC